MQAPYHLSQAEKGKPQKLLAAEEIFKRAVPSVVGIDCLGPNSARIGAASGFIAGDAGGILTSFP